MVLKKGSKLKRYEVYVNKKSVGQELAFSKVNALKNVKSRFGKKAKIKKIVC